MTWPTFSHKGEETQVDKQLVARESYGEQIQGLPNNEDRREERGEENAVRERAPKRPCAGARKHAMGKDPSQKGENARQRPTLTAIKWWWLMTVMWPSATIGGVNSPDFRLAANEQGQPEPPNDEGK